VVPEFFRRFRKSSPIALIRISDPPEGFPNYQSQIEERTAANLEQLKAIGIAECRFHRELLATEDELLDLIAEMRAIDGTQTLVLDITSLPKRLLLPHIAGPNLRRISDPYLVAQTLDQVQEPLAVTACLDPDQRRRRQLPIEALGLARPVYQPPLGYLARLRIKNRNLLPTGMEITPYNKHEGSFLLEVLILKSRLQG
jgi:hypothetical protein